MTGPSLSRRLAELLRRDVRAEARDHALSFLIDTVGCVLGAAATPEGAIATRHARVAGPSPEARGFQWAMLAHALELDDLHRASVTHPACVVIPAALAVARARRATPRELLDAIVRGYEACLRVGEAVGAAHYRVFHNTATCGVFGSAAAAGSILALDLDALVWALGNAGTVAAGLWQFQSEGAMTKPLHAGHAARSGVTAAYLAAEGLTGAERILEGPKGFFAGLCAGEALPEALLAPARGWKIGESSLKPWGSCRHTHPAIDVALRLARDLDASTVESVTVRGYRTIAELCDCPAPRTPTEARFSVQHAVAVALVRGRVDFDAFEGAAIDDPAVAALRGRVRFVEAESFTQGYPARWSTELVVTAGDGTETRADTSSARGDPESPLDHDEVDAKAIELIVRGRGWDDDRAAELVAWLRELRGSEQPQALDSLWAALDQG